MYFSDSNGQIIFNILDILNSYSQLHRGCANISEQGLRQLHTLLVPPRWASDHHHHHHSWYVLCRALRINYSWKFLKLPWLQGVYSIYNIRDLMPRHLGGQYFLWIYILTSLSYIPHTTFPFFAGQISPDDFKKIYIV